MDVADANPVLVISLESDTQLNWEPGSMANPIFIPPVTQQAGSLALAGDTYVSGTPINASASFAGLGLEDLGLAVSSPAPQWSWTGDSTEINVVPLPAALPLLGTALAAIGGVAWRRRRTAEA